MSQEIKLDLLSLYITIDLTNSMNRKKISITRSLDLYSLSIHIPRPYLGYKSRINQIQCKISNERI